jgi:hypothetical protein
MIDALFDLWKESCRALNYLHLTYFKPRPQKEEWFIFLSLRPGHSRHVCHFPVGDKQELTCMAYFPNSKNPKFYMSALVAFSQRLLVRSKKCIKCTLEISVYKSLQQTFYTAKNAQVVPSWYRQAWTMLCGQLWTSCQPCCSKLLQLNNAVTTCWQYCS